MLISNLNFLYKLINLNRRLRRLLLIFIDLFIILAAISLVISKVESNIEIFNYKIYSYYFISCFFGITLYILTGQYRGITRFQGSSFFYELIYRNSILSIFSYISFIILFQMSLSLSYLMEFFITISSLSLLIRFLLIDILNKFYNFSPKKVIKVAIYGAGNAGAQLEFSLRMSNEYEVICFFDDNKSLSNRFLNNKPIFLPNKLDEMKYKIDKVLLAIPSLNNTQKTKILNFLTYKKVSTYIVPSIEELSSGKASISSIRPIYIEDILGRNSVSPKYDLLIQEIKNKVICIIGAAGSIGGQLCKEIIMLKPEKIICIDQSEIGLYKLEHILSTIQLENNYGFDIKYILTNAQNEKNLKYFFEKYNIDIIFHAAAYKHVPLVENNSLTGIFNNVGCTLSICKAAIRTNVNKVMLISTDKAVRPTNVMGASKRLSELIFQAYASNTKNTKNKTIFSMVRFGNVLNSSGSVVPLFRSQIKKGGPITVTDKNVTRYFMTMEEAAQLVIQSISLAEGGEVFILDMGSPVKIYKLAKQMILLSGLSIKDDNNSNGDIEIKITGMRPGEKLYEELLIDASSEKTKHNLIFKALENYIDLEILLPKLQILYNLIDKNNEDKALEQLSTLVPEWDRK